MHSVASSLIAFDHIILDSIIEYDLIKLVDSDPRFLRRVSP